MPYLDLSPAARLVFLVTIAALGAGELLQTFRTRRDATRVNAGAEIVVRAAILGAILLLPIGRVVAPGAVVGAPFFAVGALIAWLGLVLRWWSFVSLGKYFTVVVMTSADQPVVERGPYRVLRHPSYTGLLLVFAGIGLMLGNWVSLLGAVGLLLVALLYRIRVEEHALSTALGERYRAFAAGRARLIPFIW